MAKVVEITWLDACRENAILDKDVFDGMSPLTRCNVGYLIKENEAEVTISFGLIENIYKGNTGIDEAFTIPRGCITDIKELSQ